MRCSAVLLAGGKSSRMGRDKALLEINGKPLWRHQLATLENLSPRQLMLSGPHCQEGDYEILTDELPDAGPLAGVAAALRRCRTPRLVVLAVDLPEMTADFLRALLDDCGPSFGIVPRSPDGFEPLAAIYPVACRSFAMKALHDGQFSMQNFVRRAVEQGWLHERTLLPAELSLFTNLNTPADYEESRDRAIRQSR